MSSDLQRLYQQICDEEWERYGCFRPTGYQARAAEEVGRRIGRKMIEEDLLYRILQQYWPLDASEWREVSDRLHNMRPAIRGNTKNFYVLREVLIVLRDIRRRPHCAVCRRRYNRDVEYRDGDRWWQVNWAPNGCTYVRQWTCSEKCWNKAQKYLEKEFKWLKIAKKRIKQARAQVRRAARNPVARQFLDART